jgi:hypothetical protein
MSKKKETDLDLDLNIAPSGTAPTPEKKQVESKADKFRRLANRRVPRAVAAIGYCRNLAARSQYETTQQQRELLVDTLQRAVDQVRSAFEGFDSVQHTAQLF